MDDDFLLRYSRHILLPEIDLAGQEKLGQARVLVVGLGGLGSPAAIYLAAAGVGHLVLADHDCVELSNLQRQIVHTQASLGRAKAESAAETLARCNPLIRLTPRVGRLEGAALEEEVRLADAVVDCTDNFPTRFLLNETCVRLGKPLISGAAVRFEGQLTVFLPNAQSPCYRCLYHETDEAGARCSENGVFAPLVGVIGSLQAAETLKVLLGVGEVLCGRLLLFDAKTMEWRTLKLRRDPRCPVCGGR